MAVAAFIGFVSWSSAGISAVDYPYPTTTTSTSTTTTLPPPVPTLFAVGGAVASCSLVGPIINISFGNRPDLEGQTGVLSFSTGGSVFLVFQSNQTVTIDYPNTTQNVNLIYSLGPETATASVTFPGVCPPGETTTTLPASTTTTTPAGPTTTVTGATTTTVVPTTPTPTTAPASTTSTTSTSTTIPSATTTVTSRPPINGPAAVTPAPSVPPTNTTPAITTGTLPHTL